METAPVLFLVFIFFFSGVVAQERSHGLDYKKPVALSPSAYEFFHPNDRQDPCARSNCSPLPIATQVEKTESGSESATTTNVRGVGVRAIVAPAFAILIILSLAMGIYYFVTARRGKLSLTKALAPNV